MISTKYTKLVTIECRVIMVLALEMYFINVDFLERRILFYVSTNGGRYIRDNSSLGIIIDNIDFKLITTPFLILMSQYT